MTKKKLLFHIKLLRTHEERMQSLARFPSVPQGISLSQNLAPEEIDNPLIDSYNFAVMTIANPNDNDLLLCVQEALQPYQTSPLFKVRGRYKEVSAVSYDYKRNLLLDSLSSEPFPTDGDIYCGTAKSYNVIPSNSEMVIVFPLLFGYDGERPAHATTIDYKADVAYALFPSGEYQVGEAPSVEIAITQAMIDSWVTFTNKPIKFIPR